jgi:hypothetical protein
MFDEGDEHHRRAFRLVDDDDDDDDDDSMVLLLLLDQKARLSRTHTCSESQRDFLNLLSILLERVSRPLLAASSQ